MSEIYDYSGTPLNGHPSTSDTNVVTGNSQNPDCRSVDFNTFEPTVKSIGKFLEFVSK